MKKVTVKVMSREQIVRYAHKPHNEDAIVISITDWGEEPPYVPTKWHASPSNGILSVLFLHFDDVEAGEPLCITEKAASQIKFFVNNHPEIPEIIVQCKAGVSRSAGVAAALLLALNGDDSEIFQDGHYCPNMVCYKTVSRIMGCELKENDVLEKFRLNSELWKKQNLNDA